MKRAFVLFQWLVLAGVIAGFAYSMLKPVPPPFRDSASWRDWGGFMAISYRGITRDDDPENVTPRRFAEQMEALERAGYRTVTPEDLEAYLKGRAPLPEKALVLLFEGGRKDSSLYATPVLRKCGYCATLFVPTRCIDLWGGFFLKSSEIKSLVEDPHWQVGSMGHAAIDLIPVDAAGTRGHFLGRRRYRAGLPERDLVLRKRIAMDYARASEILVKLTGGGVSAYLYPYADAGRGGEADPATAEINRKVVERFHRIAFAHDGNPFNGAGCDPFDLTRLRVCGKWDGERLVRELEKRRPCASDLPVEGFGLGSVWRFSEESFVDGGALFLSAGASARAATAGEWSDVDLTARVFLDSGSAARIYVRWTNPQAFLCLTLDETGVVFQERLPDGMETLFRRWRAVEAERDHRLGLRVKGRRAWISLDGEAIGGSVPLRRDNREGGVVLEAGGGTVRLSEIRIAPLEERAVLAENLGEIPFSMRVSNSVVIPAWFTQGVPGFIEAGEVMNLRRGADAGVRTVPVAGFPEGQGEDDAPALCDRIHDLLGRQGLRPLIDTVATQGPNPGLPAAFLNKGYGVIVILTPEETERLTVSFPRDAEIRYLVSGNGPETKRAVDHLLRLVPPTRIMATLSSSQLPPGVVEVVRVPGSVGGRL